MASGYKRAQVPASTFNLARGLAQMMSITVHADVGAGTGQVVQGVGQQDE